MKDFRRDAVSSIHEGRTPRPSNHSTSTPLGGFAADRWQSPRLRISIRNTKSCNPRQLGTSSNSRSEPIFECLEDIRNSGFGRIEICSFPAHLDYHDVERVKRAARLIDELGLETYSFHAPFSDRIDITSPDPQVRDFALKELLKAAEAAAILKVRYFVIHPGPENATLPEHERFWRLQNAVGVLNQAFLHCRRLGVGLVLENMLPHLFAGRTRDLLWILGALDCCEVGVCLDTGHAHLGEDLPAVVHKLSGHLWMVHASDNHRQYDDHLPPGDGKINWAALLAHLYDLHFNGTFILEIGGTGDRREILEGARRGRHHLRQLSHRLRVPG